jgi:hypothetical protein
MYDAMVMHVRDGMFYVHDVCMEHAITHMHHHGIVHTAA